MSILKAVSRELFIQVDRTLVDKMHVDDMQEQFETVKNLFSEFATEAEYQASYKDGYKHILMNRMNSDLADALTADHINQSATWDFIFLPKGIALSAAYKDGMKWASLRLGVSDASQAKVEKMIGVSE